VSDPGSLVAGLAPVARVYPGFGILTRRKAGFAIKPRDPASTYTGGLPNG